MSEYELVMPFVVCESNGGSYPDAPFVAGWECGALDTRLKHERPEVLDLPVRTASLPQVDLITMKHGYQLIQIESDEEWSSLRLVRTDQVHPG